MEKTKNSVENSFKFSSPGRVLVEVDLGVFVASSARLLHPATLDSHEDHDDGGEDADNHRGDPDSDQVLLLKPLLDHILYPEVNKLHQNLYCLLH